MCAPADTPAAAGLVFFSPNAKCCTYTPRFPNFLVGRILSDKDPSSIRGRTTVEDRIRKRVAVTPLGLMPNPVQRLLYDQDKGASFGRSATLLCPHYQEDTGQCGVWKYREATCATWFCKHSRGAVGMHFWHCLRDLLYAIEEDLARWCIDQIGLGSEALLALFPPREERKPSLDQYSLDGQVNGGRYALIWGNWAGREIEFFEESARLVETLKWTEVAAICGPQVRILLRVTEDAFRRLISQDPPPALRLKPFQTVQVEADSAIVVGYSHLNPLRLPKKLTAVLHCFDGRPNHEVLDAIYRDHGLRLDSGILRKLSDYGILGP